MTRGLRDPGRRRATLLAALLQLTSLQAMVAAGVAQQTCMGKSNITFTVPASTSSNYARIETLGVRNVVGWMQRHFAALVLSEPSIPEGLLPLNDTYRAVETMANATNAMTLLVLLGSMLAVLVPVVGLMVLMCRCLCGLCGGKSEQETKDDIGKRNTWGCLFTVFYVPLMMFLVFAITCFNHVPATISSVQGQAKFLAERAPEVLLQPVKDTDVLVNTNSEEFEKAVSARLDACATDMGDAVERAVVSSPLIQFIKTTAKYLQAAEPIATKLVVAVEDLKGNMSDLWRPYIQNASMELDTAEMRCPGCVAASHKKHMDAFNVVLTMVSASVDQLKTLRDKLKNANLEQHTDKIDQGSLVKTMLKSKVNDLQKALGDFLDVGRKLFNTTAEKYVSGVTATLDSLKPYTKETISDPVNAYLSLYFLAIFAVILTMGVVCALYTTANQCSCSSSRTGLCSLHSGSWLLSGAVLFFLLTFSLPMVASSISMVLGIAIERFVCHPLEHPTAPECRPLLAFAHESLFPPQQKKKQRSSEAKKPVGSHGRHQGADAGKLDDSAIDGGQQHAPEILEAISDGPLGDLDASNGLPPVSSSLSQPLTMSKKGLHDIPERWVARRYQLRRLLAANEEVADDDADESDCLHDFSSQGVVHTSNRSRRSKRAVVVPKGQERDSYVWLASGGEDYITDVEQVKRHRRYSGSAGVEESATEFLPLLGDVARGRPGWSHLQRDRRPRDDVFASDEGANVPAVRRGAAVSRDSADDDLLVDDGGALGENETVFSLPVDVKSYGRIPRGLPHRDDVVFARKRSVLPLWEDADMWASTPDSPVIVLQEGDRGAEDVSVVSSWRRHVPVGRPHGGDNVAGISRFSGGPAGSLRLAVDEESREGEAKHRGRHRLEVGPGLATFPGHLASRGEGATNGSYGRGSGWNGGRRSGKFQGNYHTAFSVRRHILRKHFHSRHDYWQTPVEDPKDFSASGGTTRDKAAEEKSVDDMISAALKLFTLDAVVGILNRFRDCSLNKHSVFQLVGPDLAVDLATAFVGNSSPWLSVLEQEGAPPKFDAVEGMTADLSSFHLPAEVEGQLKGLDDDSLTPAFFDEFGRNATKARTAMQDVIASRETLKSQQQAPHAQQYVASAVAALNGITSNEEKSLNTSVETVVAVCGEMKKALTIDQQTTFKEYLKANLDQWTLLQRNLTSGLDMVKDMMPSIRKLVYSDIGLFFDHARVQVREQIGDCRPFYMLYSMTVDAVCAQGIRRFGEFWFCVWWWFILGVPCFVAALALSTYYARTSPQATNREGGDGDA